MKNAMFKILNTIVLVRFLLKCIITCIAAFSKSDLKKVSSAVNQNLIGYDVL